VTPKNIPTFGITGLIPKLVVGAVVPDVPEGVTVEADTPPVAEALVATASNADNEGNVTPALEHNCSA
jgi:hypothetical protein